MRCGAGFTGFVIVYTVEVGDAVVALIEMEIEISAAVGTSKHELRTKMKPPEKPDKHNDFGLYNKITIEFSPFMC